MQRVTVVSVDGHASVPPTLWSEYLEKPYHEWLPRLREENALYTRAFGLLNGVTVSPKARTVFDKDGVYDSGLDGLWNRDVRLAELDREGVAAEFIFYGGPWASDLFHNTMNGIYPPNVVDAGARAYNRWAADTFGPAGERLLLCGALGSGTDVNELVDEVTWAADHRFVGTYTPGFNGIPGLPPLDDEYWDPAWATYAETGLIQVIHGGYGYAQGFAFGEIESAIKNTEATGGSDTDVIVALTSSIFNETFFNDLSHRRAMWQLMLGGAFDRHPNMKVMLTEVRADWLPATLRHLDAIYEKHRADLPAKRKPSEYWQDNCMAGVSFMHKAEVEMRYEIGIDKIAFGRDYPHTEGTWPNTNDFWRLIFAGVPEGDTRRMLGENAIEFLGLDQTKLSNVAQRIGPKIEELTDLSATIDPELQEHLATRCGVLKPAEGDTRLSEIDAMLRPDLMRAGATAQGQKGLG